MYIYPIYRPRRPARLWRLACDFYNCSSQAVHSCEFIADVHPTSPTHWHIDVTNTTEPQHDAQRHTDTRRLGTAPDGSF